MKSILVNYTLNGKEGIAAFAQVTVGSENNNTNDKCNSNQDYLEQSKTSEKDALQSNFEENKKQTEKGFEFWICLQMPKKN
jgi:uncharacterized protein YccT (UPF0319 family)